MRAVLNLVKPVLDISKRFMIVYGINQDNSCGAFIILNNIFEPFLASRILD
jgi:hypothetical protein